MGQLMVFVFVLCWLLKAGPEAGPGHQQYSRVRNNAP